MAFSATIQNVAYLGAGRTKLSGSWSGSAGDAAGTMTIAGVVTGARFETFDNDATFQFIPRVYNTISSGITTLTINNLDNVATGYFEIDKLGG